MIKKGFVDACMYGRSEIAKYLYNKLTSELPKNKYGDKQCTMTGAVLFCAVAGHVDILDYLLTQCPEHAIYLKNDIHNYLFFDVCRNGTIRTMNYFVEHGYQISLQVYTSALKDTEKYGLEKASKWLNDAIKNM